MKQSIRALGWAVTLTSVILIVFLVSVFYSVAQLFMTQGMQFGEFKMDATEEQVTLSMQFIINNTAFFDINDFNITTSLKDTKGSVISEKTTIIQTVQSGQSVPIVHNLTLSFLDFFTNRTYLLFEDVGINIDFSIGFKYAYLLGFQISLKNMTMPWGAPLYGLRVTGANPILTNETHVLMELQLEVENHSFLDAGAILNLRVYNEQGRQVGTGIGSIFVPQGQRLTTTQALVELTDPAGFTGNGYIIVDLEIPGVLELPELWRVNYG